MGFTDTWDNTAPKDSAAANQLGAFLRNFKTDTQQRMDAISGLDANKPNYVGDSQASGWNGRIFLATDSPALYQFNGTGFTDISLNFLKSLSLADQTTQTYSGAFPNPIIVGTPIPILPLTPKTMFRITMFQQLFLPTGNPGDALFGLVFGGVDIALFGLEAPVASTYLTRMSTLGVNTSINSQIWNSIGDSHSFVGANPTVTHIDTSQPTQFQLQYKSHGATDVLTYFGLLVELF